MLNNDCIPTVYPWIDVTREVSIMANKCYNSGMAFDDRILHGEILMHTKETK